MTGPRVAMAVLGKDLLLDLRTRDRLGHMLLFSALVIVVLSIALPSSQPTQRVWIPALLWVVFLFTALLGLERSFQSESEEAAIVMLVQVPCDRGWVFLGKAAANFLALVGVEAWTALLAAVFLDVSWGGALPAVILVGVLGAAGLAALGTLLAAMATSARFGGFLLPLLLFPPFIPVLVWASRLTERALLGLELNRTWLGMLALYDWVFILLAYFVFDYVLED